MAGIYIHIPFCKQACHYCDFHFSTSLKHKTELVDALAIELTLRKDDLQGATINTIYFGGGTPSLLKADELKKLMDTIRSQFSVAPNVEVTLEANPDDLTQATVKHLVNGGINRLSIGIQSFIDRELQLMNRAHSAKEALECVKRCQNAGITNLSIDLIYGMPNASLADWESNIKQAIALKVPHLSAYCLTVEPRTALHKMVSSGEVVLPSDNDTSAQFLLLRKKAIAAGFEHYEISNFALPNKYSQHNSAYWKNVPYLGIGPSAHSYEIGKRSWNASNNAVYRNTIASGTPSRESETIDTTTAYNEYVLTGMRTIWGCSTAIIEQRFGASFAVFFEKEISVHLLDDAVIKNDTTYRLTEKGMLLADAISSDLLFT